MIDLLTGVATVPAIVALVNLAKKLGLAPRFALVLAVVAGVGLSLATWAWSGAAWFDAASEGLLLGLAAAGLYDLTQPATPAPVDAKHVNVAPAILRRDQGPPPF